MPITKQLWPDLMLCDYCFTLGFRFREVDARLLYIGRTSWEGFPLLLALQAYLTQSVGYHHQSQGYIIYPRISIDSAASFDNQPNSVARAVYGDKCEEDSAQ
jgi:hypothetical protein